MASAVGTVGRYCGHVALFTFTVSACALLLIIVSYTNTIHCLPYLRSQALPTEEGRAWERSWCMLCAVQCIGNKAYPSATVIAGSPSFFYYRA